MKTWAGEGDGPGQLQSLFNVVKNPGADGEKSTVYAYTFNLQGSGGGQEGEGQGQGVATTLKVTDGHTTIYLFQVSPTEIVGHVGNNPEGAIAIRITLENPGSLSGAQLVVDQYMAIDHGPDGNDFDSVQFLSFLGGGEGQVSPSLGITLTATITDNDGDQASSSSTIVIADHNTSSQTSGIGFQDDGPTITSFSASGTVIQDETPGVTGADPNASNDVSYSDLSTPVQHLFDNVANKGVDNDVTLKDHDAIGYATSAASIVHVTADFGTDGAALTNAQVISLAINHGDGANSGLQTTEGREIHLFLEDGLIVGRYDAPNDGNTTVNHSDPAAFAIALGQDGSISVAQYVSLKNPTQGSSDADHDEAATGLLQNVQAVVTFTDGDGDHASQTIDVSGSIVFQDDGPTLTVTTPDSVANFLFDGFVENNAWGTGSGINTSGNAGGWAIADANDGHSGSDLISNTGSGAVQLERVGDGYDGGVGGNVMHSSTHGFMVDMDASARDLKISQTINGLNPDESYALTFEAGAPFPNEAHLEVWFGGEKVFELAPTGTMQTYTVELFGNSGDHSNLLEFRETGTPDNQGTYLANIKMADVIVIDETPNHDSDFERDDGHQRQRSICRSDHCWR